jgi:peptidoglycan-associated lipoprotein
LNRRNRTLLLTIFALALFTVAGCKKKHAAPPPPPPPPPAAAPAPTAELSATPSVISSGDQVTLKWETTGATSVSIDNGVGDVPTSGVKTVTPSQTTTYHLTATGDGGTADATATVTVNAPPAVSVAPNTMSEEQQFNANVQPIFFDYDTSDIRPDAQATLQKDADWLKQHSDVKVVVGGYCDERGSDEYNLALGQRRADATKDALVSLGVPAASMSVISYGKEKPFCTESTEQCWQLNRRAGFTMAQ